MSDFNKTLYKANQGEYVEKKSRFLCDLFYVESEAEVQDALALTKKKYYDARHHCSAMILKPDANPPMLRSSDDGEPQGTAGRPILDVLTGFGAYNILAVVTRYFGGTLLGTGGLIRSYTKAAQDALSKSEFLTRMYGYPLSFGVSYTLSGKLDYVISSNNIPMIDKSYAEDVNYEIILPEGQTDRILKLLSEETSGNIAFEPGPLTEFAQEDGIILTGSALLPPK